MKTGNKIYFLDYDYLIEINKNLNKYFILNEFKIDQRNLIYIENLLYKKQTSLKKFF